MGDRTSIEWTATRNPDGTVTPGSTWNPIRARNIETGKVGWFCTHASPGCVHCYAETLNHRLGTGIDFKAQNRDKVEVYLDEKMLTQPMRWQRPRKIFVGSMTDLFGEFVSDEMIDRVFAAMSLSGHHTFIVLTKRADRMRDYVCSQRDNPRYLRFNEHELSWTMYEGCIPRHVWLGVSVEDQQRADERIPLLLDTPAAVRWISAEPLLGPVDLDEYLDDAGLSGDGRSYRDAPANGLRWVVAGGESGPGARPMDPVWARSLRDQCAAAGVPYFFKQWGQWHADALRYTDMQGRNPPPNMNIGKKAAGRLLDGREHNEFPA